MQSAKYESFLSLVCLGIGYHIDVLPQNLDWHTIQTLAKRQGLYAVVLDGIDRLPNEKRPSQELLLEWIGEVLQCYDYRYDAYKNTIAEMARFYNSHGLKMMVLKGYACSLNWPKPKHRPCGDVDIWQFGDYKKADALVANTKKIKVDNSHHHHTCFCWGGFSVENHYDIINVHHHKSNASLEKIFKELGMDDSHSCDVDGEKVYLPSSNFHALFLLKHTMTDFAASSITLRQLLDWGFHVQKHTSEIDWGWLQGIIEKYHMKDFFDCINAICVEDLGFQASMFPYVQFNPFLKDKVLNDILNPRFTREEPHFFLLRLARKYKRWQGNAWKHKMCYNESLWSGFWSGIWAHLLKPSSI